MEDILLNVNKKEFSAHFGSDSHDHIIIGDKSFEVELIKKIGDNIYSFMVNQKIFQVELDFSNNGDIEIDLNGMNYQVQATNSTKKLLSKFIKYSGASSGAGIGNVKAPMPGLVVKIFVEEGMNVMIGDKLVIVEAMKMENVLKSTVSGIVKKVIAKEGNAVDKDALLIVIEVLT
jgi:biotin carboxyl carrier protein